MVSTADANASASNVSAQPGPKGAREWFWRGHALSAARRAQNASAVRRERRRRAKLAAELAGRQLSSDEPLRAGSALPLALSLYREAAFWTLLSDSAQAEDTTLRALFGAAEAALAGTGLATDELAAVRVALVDKAFVQTADDRPEVQRREAELADKLLCRLQRDWETGDPVVKVLTQRWVRVGASSIIVLGALFTALIFIQRWWQGPDLASGKPWRASSTEFVCHPQNNECGGAKTNIFFHTFDEATPWLEIDLGSAQTFRRLQVANRDDCCLERAIPLVAEVSSDQQHWRVLGREADSFRHWEITFAPQTARYVRLRVDRQSILHLGRVSVRAR